MMEIGKQTGGINWVNKSKTYYRGGDDVQIGVSRYKDKIKQASIILRNNIYKKFDTGYIIFGISGTRLYMKSSSSENGFKLTEATNGWNKYIKVKDETLTDWCSKHKGNYSLQYDSEAGLNYIETNKEN